MDGPASVMLVSGEASCLGATLTADAALSVSEDRRIPLETGSQTVLDIRFGKGGTAKQVSGSAIPVGWSEASTLIRQLRPTVAILGDVDSGKSTLSTFLANECVNEGLRVGLIDADIGQADIGPPTTVSFSQPVQGMFSLQDLSPEKAFFIGDTSPSLVSEKVLERIGRLKNYARPRVAVLLVNTDGWVRDPDAVRYKRELLERIHPDFILGIASERELDPILETQQSTILKLERAIYARSRSREERKKAREFGYRRFLRDGQRLEFRMGSVRLRRFDSPRQLGLSRENLRGVLAGLLDEEEWLLSIGRVEGLRDNILVVRAGAPVSPGIVELGAVILSSSYEEVGFDA